jgi:hypothetical protein
MYSSFTEWLEENQIPCFYRKIFGIDCPGCGMQRAIIELLKGNILDSIIFYPPLIPIIITLIFLLLHLIFKIRNGHKVLKIMFIISISIVFVNYFIKFCS